MVVNKGLVRNVCMCVGVCVPLLGNDLSFISGALAKRNLFELIN